MRFQIMVGFCAFAVSGAQAAPYVFEGAQASLVTTGFTNQPVLADFDNDGDLDAAIPSVVPSSSANNKLFVFLNRGNAQGGREGDFAPPTSYAAGDTPIWALAADLDNDGDKDIAVLDSNADAVRILLNQGLAQSGTIGTFALAQTITGGGDLPRWMVADDFDGDGDLDLAATWFTSANVRIFVNQGLAQSGSLGTFALGASLGATIQPVSVASGDIDNDGDVDLAITRRTTNPVLLYINQGGNQSGTEGVFSVGTGYDGDSSEGMLLRDVDNDNDLDIVHADPTGNSELAVRRNSGGLQGGTLGAFGSLSLYSSLSTIQYIASNDVDGDNDLDFIIVSDFGIQATGGAIMVNAGGAQAGTIGTFSQSNIFRTGDRPTGLATGDVDGDGDLDLAIANRNSEKLELLYNRGGDQGGTLNDWNAVTPISVTGLDTTNAADIDSDGDTDWLIARGTVLEVRRNQGGLQGGTPGTFSAAVTSTFSSDIARFVADDFDQDGDLDIAGADRVDNLVYLLVNNGNLQAGTIGTFATPTTLTTGTTPVDVVSVDYDNDTDKDLVSLDQASDRLTLFTNQGNLQGGTAGAFASPGTVTGLSSANSMIAADIDGDNDADLVVADPGADLLRTFINQGGAQSGTLGAFSAGATLAAGFDPRRPVAADLDGDGDLDLYSPDNTGDSIRVFINQGGNQAGTTGSFMAGTTMATDPEVDALKAIDVDGDNDLDLLANSSSSWSVAVFLNQAGFQGGTMGDLVYSRSYSTNGGSDFNVVDLDGDLDPDFLAGLSQYTNTVPHIKSVSVTGPRSIEVTFTESNLTNYTSASVYSISGTGKGSLTTTPDSVTALALDKVSLAWLGGEMLDGGDVTIAVASTVQDSFENPVGFQSNGTVVGGGVGDPDPVVSSIVPRNAGPVNSGAQVIFDVVFTEPVSNFDAAADLQFAYTSSANVGGTVTVSGSGTTYEVSVAGATGDGTYTLAVKSSSGIVDSIGQSLSSTLVVSSSVAVDNTAPALGTAIQLLDPAVTALDAVRFGVAFNEPVSPSFTIADIEVLGLAGTPDISGTDPNYTVTVTLTNPSANGSAAIRIGTGVQDAAGNPFAGVDSGAYTISNPSAVLEWMLLAD